MDTTTRKNNALELKDRIAIYEFLKDVCAKNEADEAIYLKGWDDTAVAAHLKVTTNNVYGVRLQMFGKLHKVKKVNPNDIIGELIDKVDAAEKQITEVFKRLDYIESIMPRDKSNDKGAYLPLGNGAYPSGNLPR